MIEKWRNGWRGRVLREREGGPLSVIQTEQTDSILVNSRLRAESSQGRQKAYSSLESSLDNIKHTHTNLNRRRTGTAPSIQHTLAHKAKYTHLNSPPDTRPQFGKKKRNQKRISVDSFNTKRAERQKSPIHVRLNTETMSSQTICWPMQYPRPHVYI